MSLPIIPTNGFPDSVMGGNVPPYGVARWIPSMNSDAGGYVIYSWLTGGVQDLYPEMEPGQGFWMKTSQAKTISPSGSLWPTNKSISIDLDPSGSGWNQFGSPFNSQVPWSSVMVQITDANFNPIGSPVSLFSTAAAAVVRDYAWEYDSATNNYALLSTVTGAGDTYLKAWYGYWIRALAYCQLIIPAQSASASTASAESTSSAKTLSSAVDAGTQASGWRVTLKAVNGSTVGAGQIGGNASQVEMLERPMPIENYVDLYFTDSGAGHYADDIRTSVNPGDKWTFNVVSDGDRDVQLTWEGVPSQVRLTLVDETGNRSVTMSANGYYAFRLAANALTRKFHIIAE
jgi:hypothetical protein